MKRILSANTDNLGIQELRNRGYLNGWTRAEVLALAADRREFRKTHAGKPAFNVYTQDPNCKQCGKNKRRNNG